MLLPLLLTLADTDTIFACSFGPKQVEVVREGSALTYRFGRPGKPELEIVGSREAGNLAYRRELFARAENQHLRFTAGDHDYVVFQRWAAPSGDDPEENRAGLVVMKKGATLARLHCRDGGELREHTGDAVRREPLLPTLPQDPISLVPDR